MSRNLRYLSSLLPAFPTLTFHQEGQLSSESFTNQNQKKSISEDTSIIQGEIGQCPFQPENQNSIPWLVVLCTFIVALLSVFACFLYHRWTLRFSSNNNNKNRNIAIENSA